MQHIPAISHSVTDWAIYIAAFTGAEFGSDSLCLAPDISSAKHT